MLTESWLTDGIKNSELFPGNFNVFRKDRSYSRGGGVVIAVSDKFYSSGMNIVSPLEEIDIVAVSVKSGSVSLVFVAIYVLAGIGLAKFNTLFDFLDITLITMGTVLVIGDFNVPGYYNSTLTGIGDNISVQLAGFAAVHNLKQCNNVLNHNNRLLDLILVGTDYICDVERSLEVLVEEDIHHPPLECLLQIGNVAEYGFNSQVIWRYNFKKADLNGLYTCIADVNWEAFKMYATNSDVNGMCDVFYRILYAAIDKYVPKLKLIRNKHFPPWFNRAIIKDIKRKNHYHKMYKRYGANYYKHRFCALRSSIKTSIRLSYSSYIHSTENGIKSDPRKFWSFINLKKGQSRIPGHMISNDQVISKPLDIVQEFATFFSSVYDASGPRDSSLLQLQTTITSIGPLSNISDLDVRNAIRKLKGTMTTGPDAIPSFFVKDCAECLLKPLTLIYNSIICQRVFPDEWKRARVTPVLKSGSRADIRNYRPISLISNFAKIFEMILYTEIYNHVKPYICNNQHGFLKGRSTATNLSNFAQLVSEALDERKQVDVIFTDFSKAFDCVQHHILLRKLERFGLHTDYLLLLRGYLTGRQQYVEYEGIRSRTYLARGGVAQGSNLGPLLFILFINDVCDKFDSTCLLYADDLKIYRIINTSADCDILQSDLDQLCAWCQRNCINLNVGKCKVMTFSRKAVNVEYNYEINSVNLQGYTEVTDLGVVFDSRLTFNKHIFHIYSHCCKLLGFIMRSCKDFVNIDTITILYNSLVRSRLEYCCVVWSPAYLKYVNLLESLQKRFLKYLYFKRHGVYSALSYDNLLEQFGFNGLSNNRKIIALLHLYKLVHNIIDDPVFLSRLRFYIPRFNTRNSITFLNRQAATNSYKNSPLYRMCHLYNSCNYNLDVFGDNYCRYLVSVKECICFTS